MSKLGHIQLSHFKYPLANHFPPIENKEMARLNYMASRIRAALRRWVAEEDVTASEGDSEGEIDMWWWKGLRNELVTYKS
jgi:hypothetical protein